MIFEKRSNVEVSINKKSHAQIIFDRIDAVEAFDEASLVAVSREGDETECVIFSFSDGSSLSFSGQAIAVISQ